jgi:hypothetical protein
MFRALSVATMKRSDVRKLVSAAVAPKVEDVKPTSAPVVSGSPDSAFQSWKRTSQWEQNTTLRGINPQRLGSVIQARVEAAFRAGYAAGVGDSI